MPKKKAAVSWRGGKDSYLALHRVADLFDVQALLTMFTEDGTRSRSHGLRPEVMARQASLLNFQLVGGRGSWKTYEEEFKRVLRELARDGFSHVIFGDIFLDEHKMWVERVCNECGLEAVEPLWGEPTTALLREFLATGAQAQIVATKAALQMSDGSVPDFVKRCCELSSRWAWTHAGSEASTIRLCSPPREWGRRWNCARSVVSCMTATGCWTCNSANCKGAKMRLAVLSDIHGNLTALEAVLADLKTIGVDFVVHGGDLVANGARPAQVVDIIRELGWPGVCGNTDEMLWRPELLPELESKAPSKHGLRRTLFNDIAPPTRELLGEDRVAWLRSFPRQ